MNSDNFKPYLESHLKVTWYVSNQQQPSMWQSSTSKTVYRKNSKNWDTLNYYRDCPTNGIVGFLQCNIAFKRCKQNNKQSRHWSDCSLRSSLIWVCTVCSDLSVPIFQIITVHLYMLNVPYISLWFLAHLNKVEEELVYYPNTNAGVVY